VEKIRYEIDPHNRLVVKKTGRRTKFPRFRRVLDGRFKTDKDNELTYHIKTPVFEDIKAPHQVKLRGKWSLTEECDLRFTLDKWRRQTFGDQLTLQGDIVDVSRNSLLFAVTTKTKRGVQSTYILKLAGSWQADKHNRLTFRVRKGRGRHDTLIFNGVWEVDKNHRVVYAYEKSQHKRREKLKRILRFKGHWNISRRNSLSYELGLAGKSIFDFRTGVGFLSKNYIRYELGIGVSNKKQAVRRIITLFGKWKIKRGVGLLFEIEYEKGNTGAIVFGAEARLTERNNVEFRLTNTYGRDLGMKLKLSRKLLGGEGEAFLNLLKSRRESRLYLGTGWRW